MATLKSQLFTFLTAMVTGGGLTGLLILLRSRGDNRAKREEIYADHTEELFKELRETRQEREKLAGDNLKLQGQVSELQYQVSDLKAVINSLKAEIKSLHEQIDRGDKVEDFE